MNAQTTTGIFSSSSLNQFKKGKRRSHRCFLAVRGKTAGASVRQREGKKYGPSKWKRKTTVDHYGIHLSRRNTGQLRYPVVEAVAGGGRQECRCRRAVRHRWAAGHSTADF